MVRAIGEAQNERPSEPLARTTVVDLVPRLAREPLRFDRYVTPSSSCGRQQRSQVGTEGTGNTEDELAQAGDRSLSDDVLGERDLGLEETPVLMDIPRKA